MIAPPCNFSLDQPTTRLPPVRAPTNHCKFNASPCKETVPLSLAAKNPEQGIDPALMHRVAVIGAGTPDSLPHNGAVVTLLAVCGATHRESYLDIVMVAIVGALLALAAVIALGAVFGSS
jgi:hypothetical protein